jgi:hypothetical protein
MATSALFLRLLPHRPRCHLPEARSSDASESGTESVLTSRHQARHLPVENCTPVHDHPGVRGTNQIQRTVLARQLLKEQHAELDLRLT